MTETCPACHTSRSVSGACSCDVDGIPPGVWTSANPVLPTPYVDRLRSATLLRLAGSTDLRRVDDAVRELITCQVPGPDGRTWCDRCLDRLGVILRAVPAVAVEINLERDGVRGIDYRTLGGGTGGKKALPLPAYVGGATVPPLHVVDRRTTLDPTAPAAPLVVVGGAIAARDRLRLTLWQVVVACLEARLSHTSPRDDVPHRGDVPAMAEWLTWRIDAMPGHPLTDDAPGRIALAVEHALHAVDRPATRQRLGDCPYVAICGGHLLATEGSAIARCDSCGHETDADAIREERLAELDDRLCTAAEIADLTTYLGGQTITATRDVVRRRINSWAHAGKLVARPGAEPRYRFADAYALLLAHQDRHVHAWSDWAPAPEQPDPDVVVMLRSCEFETCTGTKTRRRPAPRGQTRRSS